MISVRVIEQFDVVKHRLPMRRVGKGVPIGTVLALMMSVAAISLPEMIILRKVLKPQLIATFTGILFIAFIGVGFLFNAALA